MKTHRLSHNDWQQLERGLAELYAPDLSPTNFLPRSFTLLRSLVPSDLIAYGTADREKKTLEITLSEMCPAAVVALEGFARCMGRYELFNWNPKVNEGQPFHRGDFYSRREFRNLDIYTECYHYLGLNDHLAVHVPSGPESTIFFGVERNGHTDFTERDRAILSMLQTHLGNARSLALSRCELPKIDPDIVLPRFRAAGYPPREAEILYWIMEGKTLSEIGIILNIQRTTAKTHLESLYFRLGVESRTQAVLRGMELVASITIRGSGSYSAFENIDLAGR